MMAALPPTRNDRMSPRAPAARGADPAADPSAAGEQAAIAAQHAAFDAELAERSELLREHEALQTLLMEQLKNEDAIMKKWIALI
ncbi:MAG: hypothetical protein JO175_09600 [Candidatus Eremiobacteraeota bacterium]|nr:hypothetical protein [Candidatus Eremiobacteraeota bacterium]